MATAPAEVSVRDSEAEEPARLRMPPLPFLSPAYLSIAKAQAIRSGQISSVTSSAPWSTSKAVLMTLTRMLVNPSLSSLDLRGFSSVQLYDGSLC